MYTHLHTVIIRHSCTCTRQHTTLLVQQAYIFLFSLFFAAFR